MSAKVYTWGTVLLVAGLVSACGSGNDATAPAGTQDTAEVESPSSDDTVTGSIEQDAVEVVVADPAPVEPDAVDSDPVDSDPGETTAQDPAGEEDTADTDPADQNGTDQTAGSDSESGQATPEAEGSDNEQSSGTPSQASLGTASLMVDLVPGDGSSYPANFQRVGDTLYFWTTNTDPHFARCAPHWGWLNDEDKSVAFNLVATDPESGDVAMNKTIMTLGDFAVEPNSACAGYNGSIMQVFDPVWLASPTANGEQQFVLHYENFGLGPDQLWKTDGTGANTGVVETGLIDEQLVFAGDKIFYINDDGLSVADTLSTDDRRTLFERDRETYTAINQISCSPARHATFNIRVAENRHQIWTYNLDTDEWEKTFSLKPDDNIYSHRQTLLVDGQTVLGLGILVEGGTVLVASGNYGDVTSFEIISNGALAISNSSANADCVALDDTESAGLVYRTTDFSTGSRETSIWRYADQRNDRLFSIADPNVTDIRTIVGLDGQIYVSGTIQIGEWPERSYQLKLWSYDLQSGQLVELSDDSWFAVIHDHPTQDESYFFRYLNTPDGLIFVNLDNNTGRELWFTDGTPEGTRQLADINPGIGDSNPLDFYHSGDAIYFSADDGVHGREPWRIPISR